MSDGFVHELWLAGVLSDKFLADWRAAEDAVDFWTIATMETPRDQAGWSALREANDLAHRYRAAVDRLR